MKAIGTNYDGYRFRSRLEARWAVFFKTLGIAYDYEKEGYDLGAAGPYLPDFWLPQVSMWAEVKPDAFTTEELDRCEALVKQSGSPCLLLVGVPAFVEYEAVEEIEGALERLPYSLTTEYLESEGRFFCQGYPEGPANFPADYHAAVSVSRSARFEHGEKP